MNVVREEGRKLKLVLFSEDGEMGWNHKHTVRIKKWRGNNKR